LAPLRLACAGPSSIGCLQALAELAIKAHDSKERLVTLAQLLQTSGVCYRGISSTARRNAIFTGCSVFSDNCAQNPAGIRQHHMLPG
jgi:hypothetical protein